MPIGLINFLKQHAAGATQGQVERRYERAAERTAGYMQVLQWYLENSQSMPVVVSDYERLSRLKFRQEHRAVLAGYRNDMTRKLGHAASIGTPGQPCISVFSRLSDRTVFCAYVLLLDDKLQVALMKPYWFLSKGEKEADYRSEVIRVINAPIACKSAHDRGGINQYLMETLYRPR